MISLRELADDASRSTTSTSELLRRLKVVASRTGLPTLDDWVSHELNGYPDVEAVPTYRGPFEAEVRGDFSCPFGSVVKNGLIPPSVFRQEIRDSWAFKIEFRQSVAELEVLAQAQQALQNHWPADTVVSIERLLAPGASLYPGCVCHGAWKAVSPQQLVGVLEVVRNRVLDMALGLERIQPGAHDVEEVVARPEDRDRARQVIYAHVYGGNVSIAGANARQAVVSIPSARDPDELMEQLASLGVPREELPALVGALEEDAREPRESDEPGPRVRQWLMRVAASSAMAVGTGAAGDVVAQVIQRYLMH